MGKGGFVRDLKFAEVDNFNISENPEINEFLKPHINKCLQGVFADGLIYLDTDGTILKVPEDMVPKNNNIIE